MLCAKFGWNWLSGSGVEDLFNFINVFSLFRNVYLGKRWGPLFEQSWIPFTQGCFVPSLVEIGSVILEKKIFLILSLYFHYFVIISPWKRAGPFIWTNLNPLHPRMLCAMFDWNWRGWKCEKFTTTMDNGQILIRKVYFSLWLSWAIRWHVRHM